MIHILIVAIITETRLTLLLFILIPLICRLYVRATLHTDIDMEYYGCDNAQE